MQKIFAFLAMSLFSTGIIAGCDFSDDLPTISTSIEKPTQGSTIKRGEPFLFEAYVRSAAPIRSIEVSMHKEGGGPSILISPLAIPDELSSISGVYGEATIDSMLQVSLDVEQGSYTITLSHDIDCSVSQNCSGQGKTTRVIVE